MMPFDSKPQKVNLFGVLCWSFVHVSTAGITGSQFQTIYISHRLSYNEINKKEMGY